MARDRALSGPILGKWPAPRETRHERVSFRHGDGIIAITSRRARLASTSSCGTPAQTPGNYSYRRTTMSGSGHTASMPLLSPVMSAMFPSNLPMCFSCLVISLWNTDSVQ